MTIRRAAKCSAELGPRYVRLPLLRSPRHVSKGYFVADGFLSKHAGGQTLKRKSHCTLVRQHARTHVLLPLFDHAQLDSIKIVTISLYIQRRRMRQRRSEGDASPLTLFGQAGPDRGWYARSQHVQFATATAVTVGGKTDICFVPRTVLYALGGHIRMHVYMRGWMRPVMIQTRSDPNLSVSSARAFIYCDDGDDGSFSQGL